MEQKDKIESGKKIGKLYGLGVGPGDPELMTLKAVRLIRECHAVAIPASGKETNVAFDIARGAVPEIEAKELLEISMPMIRDENELKESHDRAAAMVIAELEKGKDIAFLTLGDPSIYSTYIYIHNRVTALGYETEIIPGIPSFCAVAARLNEGLTEASEALHVIPASYEGIEEALALKGTRVLMKSGKSIGKVKAILEGMENPPAVKMVERCGMQGERVFRRLEDLDEEASYFSILVVKDQ
ncbi:MAG TPA: precorrin-2 C(20)-methyltransferase [Anaerovoracaceae bacterium]|nr:precorrin-2 C(20)-methyltransferase [Anaerovoracaceae bacterium]